MGTIIDKLFYLKETKELIRQSLLQKGVSVGSTVPFREYPNLIRSITSGTGPIPDPEPEPTGSSVYGVEWDITDPTAKMTRIGNLELHKTLPVQSSFKGCVSNGSTVNYYLDPQNWNRKADGSPSVLDGTDGDVRVHTPRFFGRSRIPADRPNIRIVEICLTKPVSDEFPETPWTEVPAMLIDAYRCTVCEGKTRSVVNTSPAFRGGDGNTANDSVPFKTNLGKPKTAMTQTAMRGLAKAAGSELMNYEYYKWIFYWCYIVEYANFDAQDNYIEELTPEGYHQGGLGAGVTTASKENWKAFNNYNPVTPCGYCNELGNRTGTKSMAVPGLATFQVPRWRGFENPFGDVWTCLEGICVTEANGGCDIYTTTLPAHYNESSIEGKRKIGHVTQGGGYIQEFELGSNAELIPLKLAGQNAVYTKDFFFNEGSGKYRVFKVGGGTRYGEKSGLYYLHIGDAVGLEAEGKVAYRTITII